MSQPTETEIEATAAIVEVMKEHDIVRVECSYSGGNDEGGVQEIEKAIGSNGLDRAAEFDYRGDLWAAADDLMTTKYGGWAFEGTAYGTLVVDVHEGRAWTAGEESQYVPTPPSEEIDVRFGEKESLENLRANRDATWQKLLTAEQTGGGGLAGLAQEVEYLDNRIEALEREAERDSAPRNEYDFTMTISTDVGDDPPGIEEIREAIAAVYYAATIDVSRA